MDKKIFYNQLHLFVPCILLVFYMALPYRYKMCDIIRYAEAIESNEIKASILWHPSHILYGPLGYTIYNGLEKSGKTYSPFQIYSALGIISAAFSVLLIGLLMRHFGSSSRLISLSLLLWMSTYVSWICSTSPDLARNMIAIVFILSAFYTTTLSTRIAFRGWPYITGLLLGFAGVSHILSVFSAFPLLYFAYNSSKGKIITTLKISITSILFVFSVFSFAAMKFQNINDIHGFLEWVRAPGSSQWIETNPVRGIVDLLLTSIRSIFGIVTYQPLKISILSNGMENTGILILAILAVIIISGCCLVILRSLSKTPDAFTLISKAMMLWFCSHAIFAIFFDSGNIRMLLFLGIPFTIILTDSMKAYSSSCIALGAFIVFILILTINTPTVFFKENRPETQKAFQILDAMNHLSHDPEDIFIVSTCTDASFARYFGDRKTFILDSKYLSGNSLYNIVQSNLTSGHKVFILNELVNIIKEERNKEKDPLLDSLILDSKTLNLSNNFSQLLFIHKQIPSNNG